MSIIERLTKLAAHLFIDNPDFLHHILMMLEKKRQIIFHGPPGTGKTYIAREFALTCAQYAGTTEDRVKIVQFHPSYAYEDFVEGYRPTKTGFELVEGPLKRIAGEARKNTVDIYVLLIDEINRGNIAKIFGELYYLLEYRDEQINLQYSRDTLFSLPKNLWIIGTMNSADRSIALIDAALRRRFYFIPFFPDEAPIKGVLRRWLQARKPEMEWVAGVMDEANRRLGNRQVQIGSSHFMVDYLDDEWMKIIWQHSIMPYIQEHFYSDEDRLKEFDLDTLKKVAGRNTNAPVSGDVSGPATGDAEV